jgi:hypothetical protein
VFHKSTAGLVLVLGMLAGCSGGDTVATAPLTGEVKRTNGDPFDNVTVVFYPAKGPSTVAMTDAAGRFTAEVALGEARVAVVPKNDATSTDMSPKALNDLKKQKSRIKPRYSSPDTSGFTVKVEPKQTEKVVFVVE